MGIDQLPPQPKTIPITFASNLQNIQTADLRAAPACGGPPSCLCSIERLASSFYLALKICKEVLPALVIA